MREKQGTRVQPEKNKQQKNKVWKYSSRQINKNTCIVLHFPPFSHFFFTIFPFSPTLSEHSLIFFLDFLFLLAYFVILFSSTYISKSSLFPLFFPFFIIALFDAFLLLSLVDFPHLYLMNLLFPSGAAVSLSLHKAKSIIK